MRRLFTFCTKIGFDSKVPDSAFKIMEMSLKTFQTYYKDALFEEAIETCDRHIEYASEFYIAEHPAIISMQNNKAMVLNKL